MKTGFFSRPFQFKALAFNLLALALATFFGLIVGSQTVHLGFSVGPKDVTPFLRGLFVTLILTVIAPPTGFWVRTAILALVYIVDLAVAIALGLWLPAFVTRLAIDLPVREQWEQIGNVALAASWIIGYAAFLRYGKWSNDLRPNQVQNPNATPARPWPRFVARSIDLLLLKLAVGLAVGYLAARYAPRLYFALNSRWALFEFLLVPIIALLLAAIMTTTGTTLGKAIMGIRVRRVAGQNALFYFDRELRVLASGLGLGLPLIWLFTYMRQYRFVVAGRPASYDSGRAEVEGRPALMRVTAGFLTIAMLLALSSYLTFLGQVSDNNLTALDPWKNPDSGRIAYIARSWEKSELPMERGRVFRFVSDPLLAVTIFGYETLEIDDADRLSYARALADALKPEITLTSLWAPVTVRGHSALRAIGRSLVSPDTAVEITVVLRGRHAWRAVVFVEGRSTDELPDKDFFVGELLGTLD